jgi:protein-S-isoprenylcysteine O-methyltransferase Ste14
MVMHLSAEAYLTVASILAGFGVTVLMFRIQRELQVENDPDWTWLPWADWLVLGSIVLSLVGVVLPLVSVRDPGQFSYAIAAASCAAASLLLAAYPFAIIDHYRLAWGKGRWTKSMRNTIAEPGEKIIVIVTSIAGALIFASILYSRIF